MNAQNGPDPPDLTLQLPRDTYYQIIHHLIGLLPVVTDAPEDIVRRDNAAIADVASLLPANAHEVRLAAQFVAADAQASHCLQQSREHPQFLLKCTAQAASMQRQSRAALALLLRVQAERRKREADGPAASQAAWIEHCAIGLMAQALGRAPPEPMSEPPPPEPEPDPVAVAEEPRADLAREADLYATMYPRRAAQIRALGGVPDNPSYGPPSATLARAIVTGDSLILRALDHAPEPATADG